MILSYQRPNYQRWYKTPYNRLLRPLLKTGLPLMKSVIKPLARSFLLPLGLTAPALAVDAGIHKKS